MEEPGGLAKRHEGPDRMRDPGDSGERSGEASAGRAMRVAMTGCLGSGRFHIHVSAFPLLVIVLLTCAHPRHLACQALGLEGEPGSGSNFTVASAISAAFPATAIILRTVPLVAPGTSGLMPWIANPLLLGAHVPMYWVEPSRAIGYSIAGLALPAAGVGLMFAGSSVAIASTLSATLLGGYARLMEYAAYDTYRLEAPELEGHTLASLAAAPFSAGKLASPLVWIPSLAGPAALILFYLAIEPDLGTPVYESGQSRIGTAVVGPALGALGAAAFGLVDMLLVAIGEEAYYRGILYEESKRALGLWPARMMDMAVFPAIHLPGDIKSGFKPGTILFNYGWRAAMTLVYDAAYDEGDLPLSVAVHFWSDFILVMARWLFYGG